ncbi:MAG: hypothetical protein C5B52_17650 [Bacteroidetes bacterium]|nr:MAG: hypothetical protein C5B52_17650 [Bacteroidota bacterium]
MKLISFILIAIFTLFFAESLTVAAFCGQEIKPVKVCKAKGSCATCNKSSEKNIPGKKHSDSRSCTDAQCVYCPLCSVLIQEPQSELQAPIINAASGYASLEIKFHSIFANEQWKPPNFSLA